MTEHTSELRNIVEAALLAAETPLSVAALGELFSEDARPSPEQIREVFEQLDRDYAGRGVELRRVGKGWRFQSREKYSHWLRKLSETRPPRYSRALLETLAIIAYRQPVTRGDIEDVRGVTVSTEIMRQLQDRDWVKEVGHRDVPGRPALLGTTQQFLAYFSLESLGDLPPLLERRAASEIAGELNLRLPLEETGADGDQNGGHAPSAPQAVAAAADPPTDDEAAAADTATAPGDAQNGTDTDSPPTAQVISIGDALPSRDDDGEAS